MRRYAALLVFISLTSSTAAQPGALTVERKDGGSVVTDLGYGIQVNKGSGLQREWIVVNDASAPVQVTGGIQSKYKGSSGYAFSLQGQTVTTRPVVAIETISVLFDVWGNRMEGLRYTEITDRQPSSAPFKDSGWYA